MDDNVIKSEMGICSDHFQNGHCAWGECQKCGVIPLLHKLSTGEVVETASEIADLRKKYLGNEA
jgi:hypothetical protein